ncbi:MAG: hypothetical protein RML93_04755 [Anaerolineales bacterium]|nr:hypothetical protein [Anaerolineales bacterium]MDW8446587.1 hypothetical protein [Anaerolineales bacterium]
MSLCIGVVGPCAAGKTTLVKRLRSQGYIVRHIAQEHSYVPTMWRRIANPDILIYLDVNYQNTRTRKRLDWTFEEYQEQLRRLSHARAHADLIVDTNPLSEEEVFQSVLRFIENSEKLSRQRKSSDSES